MAERLAPELPMPLARHPTPWIVVVNFCTFARGSAAFAPLHCIFVSLANRPTGQPIN
jgi:hypothetical protein